jgi:hypothetical protein
MKPSIEHTDFGSITIAGTRFELDLLSIRLARMGFHLQRR